MRCVDAAAAMTSQIATSEKVVSCTITKLSKWQSNADRLHKFTLTFNRKIRFRFYPIPVQFVVFYLAVFGRVGGPKATHPFSAATDFRGCILASLCIASVMCVAQVAFSYLACLCQGKGHPTWKGSISTGGPPFGIECCGLESGKVGMLEFLDGSWMELDPLMSTLDVDLDPFERHVLLPAS